MMMFKHPQYGWLKNAPVGFSWTSLFFGPFPALLRGDYKWAAIIFGAAVVLAIPTVGVGGWVVSIAAGILYNKLYIKELITKGYLVSGINSVWTLQQLQNQLEVGLPTEKTQER